MSVNENIIAVQYGTLQYGTPGTPPCCEEQGQKIK